MRILHVNTAYPAYLARYRAAHSDLEALPFADQERAFYADAFGWADSWGRAVRRLGHAMWDVTYNMEPVQRAWAREDGLPGADRLSPGEIFLRQVAAFRPDVLFYNHGDGALLSGIRASVPSVRRVVGWCGSAVPDLRQFDGIDLVLSCAQETVELLRSRGIAAEQLHHGFDPAVAAALGPRPPAPRPEVFFGGQVLLGTQFHDARHALLNGLHARGARLRVHSDSFGKRLRTSRRVRERLRWLAARTIARPIVARWPEALPKIARYRGGLTVDEGLGVPAYLDRLAPAVYAMEMYRAMAGSAVALNVHADSSPRFASNMRLFEITGAGACMLTDAKENLGALFEPDREVVVYRSVDECAEKALWLLEHPARAAEIAAAGQARTLRDHTFDARAPELLARLEAQLRG